MEPGFSVDVLEQFKCTFQLDFYRVNMMMMASAQIVETSVNTNNSPSQGYTTNADDHSNYNIDSPGFKPFTVIGSVSEILSVSMSGVVVVSSSVNTALNCSFRISALAFLSFTSAVPFFKVPMPTLSLLMDLMHVQISVSQIIILIINTYVRVTSSREHPSGQAPRQTPGI